MRRIFLPILLYGAVLVALFGGALWPKSGMLLYGDDIHRAYYFFREFFNHWIVHGVFPWWNPSIFGGQPYIADPVVNIWYPPNWLFFVLPLNLVYSWHIAFHILWAMVGMYILVRKHKQFDIAAWVSGVVLGLSGFFVARTFAGHVDVIAAASWIPWVVGAFWRLMQAVSEKQHGVLRKFAVASICFAMQLFAGYQTMAFFTVITIGFLSVFYAFGIKKIAPVVGVALAGVVGLFLAAIQIVPEQEFFGRSIRLFSFPYAWHAYGSYELRSLLQFLNPFQFGNQYTYNGPPPNFIEHSAFVGLFGLVLSLCGVVVLLRKKIDTNNRVMGLLFGVLVFFGLWISLGPNAPVDLQKILWQFVPMYHHLRIPPRHLILVVFGLSGLVGTGMTMIKNSYLQYIVSSAVVIELLLFGRGFISLNKIPEIRHDPSLIAYLKQDAAPYRLLQNFGVWLPQRDVLDFDGVMAYNIQSATGYDPSILKSYYEFVEALNKSTRSSLVDHDVQVPYMDVASSYVSFLGVKYLMLPNGTYDPSVGRGSGMWKLMREDKSAGYTMYVNLKVMERFFFVSNAQFYKTREPILQKLRQEVDLGATVLIRDKDHLEGEVKLPCGKEGGQVTVTSYTPNKIMLEVDTPCDAYLSSSEIYYPGWHAKIDNKEARVYESNIAFRTLFVPRGKHTVIYEYSPTIFVIGGVITSITGLFLFWLMKRKS